MIVKRARGHRLYTQDGKKILDLSMGNGRGVLGHRPKGLSLTLKNSIDRGLYAPYENIYLKRLKNYINKKFKEYSNIYILHSEDSLTPEIGKIKDPLLDTIEEIDTAYWRPYLSIPDCESLILLYPMSGLNTTTILISKSPRNIVSSDVSPILLSGILRSFYDFEQELKDFKSESYTDYSKIINSTLKPPYLILDRDITQYRKLVDKALEYGILLNKLNPIVILPPDYSRGEISKVVSFLNGGE